MVKSVEQVMADIQAIIGDRPHTKLDIPDYLSILANHKGIDLGAPTDFSNYAISTQSTKKKKKKKGSSLKMNFWDMISGTLGQPSGIFTNSAYNMVKDIKDKDKSVAEKIFDVLIKDNVVSSLVQGIGNGAKEQVKDWGDGKTTWGDVPLVGALHGMDKGWKRGSDIMDEVGVKNRWGNVGGGIALDIALDPLTYLTGGLSMATKMGKAAELKKMAEISKTLGLGKKFKKTDDLMAAVEEMVKAKHMTSVQNVANITRQQYAKFPHLVEDMVVRKVADHQALLNKQLTKKLADVADEIKTARNTTFNSNINKWGASVPFTNKAVGIGNIKEGNLLHRTEATVDNPLVQDLLNHATKGDGSLKSTLEQVIKQRYNVNSLDELTKTHFDDLHEHLAPVIKAAEKKGLPHVAITQKIVEHEMPQEKFAGLMNDFRKQNIKWDVVKNQLNDILLQTGHDRKLRASFGSHLAEMVADYWKNTTVGMRGISKADRAARGQSMEWASKFLKDSDTYKTVDNVVDKVHPHGTPEQALAKNASKVKKATTKLKDTTYNEMTNAKTSFEHFLDKKNPFDARTLGTGDKFVNSMADHIADANSQRLGETAMYTKGMEEVQKLVTKGKYTPDEMKQAIYTLEGKAPDSLGGRAFTPSRRVQQLVTKMKTVLDDIGNDDMAAGVLSKKTKGYFPHVLTKSDKDLKDMMEFDKRHPELNGLNSKNKFDKSRKSFKTIADRDNYVEKIVKAIHKETDPAIKAQLQSHLDRVENLFDMNVVSAMTSRIREGVRARAMKQMQTKLSKYGMMKTIEKGSGEAPPSGYHKVEVDEAKKLGLGSGQHYVHPEVFEGMKRVDEIFTDQNMNKAVRQLAAISDIWRPLVTYYKPSHYINNLIGNGIINIAAGVKTRDYKVAAKLIKGWKTGKLTDKELKIMKLAYKHNVVSGGFLFDAKGTYQFKESTKTEKLAEFIADNQMIKKARTKGEHYDDLTRLANFVNGMDKFGSVEQAAKQVRTYLFNYNELTKADRAMRVVVPFWNWMKRNIPLQVKLLMELPKFAQNNERFRDLFNDGNKGEDWQKETGIKIPNMDRYMSVPSPVNDLTMVENPAQLVGSSNPAIKMMLESMMNKKFYTNKPITYGSDTMAPEDIIPYIASNLGIGGDIYKLGSGESSPLEFLANLFKSTTKINPKGGS